jgi:alpha-beta hydrolase superfamily lysophospholipase
MEGVSSADKTFIPLEGAYHEAMFEESGPEVVQGVIDWILARSQNNGSGEEYSSAAKM